MANLLAIREDLKDELDCHGSYINVMQSRDDPRVVVELHEFVYTDTENVEKRVEDVVADHTDIGAEVEVA